jgi:hypothetical protein
MYNDLSTSKYYPKTLYIHNTKGGAVWQIYHVQAQHEAEQISKNATSNGFQHIEMVDYDKEVRETFDNWRDSEGGQNIINNK